MTQLDFCQQQNSSRCYDLFVVHMKHWGIHRSLKEKYFRLWETQKHGYLTIIRSWLKTNKCNAIIQLSYDVNVFHVFMMSFQYGAPRHFRLRPTKNLSMCGVEPDKFLKIHFEYGSDTFFVITAIFD